MSEMEERSSKSSSAIDRTDSASAASGGSGSGSGDASGSSSAPSGPTESSHSHISSMKTSTYGASVASDSAYGGSNTQSQRSGSGSRSSKSQNSSISSNNAAPEQPKSSRKDKDPKKRKSKAFVLPMSAAVASTSSGGPAADPSAGAAGNASTNSAAASAAASTAVANTCCSGNTVEDHSAATGTPKDDDGMANSSHGGATTSTSFTLGGTRQKKSGSRSGIRAVTESRQLQAAALSRALNSLQETGLSKESMSSCSAKEDAVSSSWRSLSTDPAEVGVRKAFAHLEEEPTVKSREAFIAAISLQDGAVVYVTTSLTDRLGYPAEMWLKRSLLDFLHPKDRLTFTNQITSKLLTGIDSASSSSAGKDDASRYSFSSASADGASGLAMFGSTTYPCNTVCARLRMYRGLRTSGFGIVDKKTSYQPYRISLMLEKINVPPVGQPETSDSAAPAAAQDLAAAAAQPHRQPESGATAAVSQEAVETDQEPDSSEFYLLAYAVPITSAYKGPEEKNASGQFGLRHSSTCLFSEVDLGSVPYLGHLPQDLLGASALDFYHPNDLPELKNIYNSVIGRQGKSVRSKPYHFRAFNGCYVLLETDWTCFVNPWTKKLEFVAGRHRVLKGPSNPDVFASPPEGSAAASVLESLDPITAENVKKLQADISNILAGTAASSLSAIIQSSQQQAPQHQPQQQQQQQHGSSARGADSELLEAAACRRKRLAALMGTLIDEVVKAKSSNSCGHSCGSCASHRHSHCHSPAEGSLLGDASVVMGDISTHGGSRTDTNSADTPLSYSQLNYNQNLDRYFQSQPKMMPSEGSGEGCSGSGLSADSKPGQTPNMSSEEEAGTREGSSAIPSHSQDSQQLSSSKSNSKSNSNSHSRTSDSQNGLSSATGEFRGLPLTKEMLARHNEEMEKEFMQHHRELRNRSSHGQARRSGKEPHGIKRGQASSWEEGPGGRNKHPHLDATENMQDCSPSPSPRAAHRTFNEWTSPLTGPTIIPVNLLPPFSVSVTPSNPPAPPVFTFPTSQQHGQQLAASGIRNAPVTPVSVSSQLPGMVTQLPAYYLPAATPTASATAAVGCSRLPGPSVHSIPMGAPLFMPQPAATYPAQPFSYLPGIIYQPMVVPPVVFQPNVTMPPTSSSHPSLSRTAGRQRHPDHRRRHHRPSHYGERGYDSEDRAEQRQGASQAAADHQADYERRYMQSPTRDDAAMGAIRRTGGRNLQQSLSHHAHSHQSTVTTRPQSEATSLRAELGSGAASYVSANAPWAPASNTMPAFQQPQQPQQQQHQQPPQQQPQPQQQQQQQWSQQGQPPSSPWSPLDNPNSVSDLSASGWQSTENTTGDSTTDRRPQVKKTPPWMESIAPTVEFVYQYQVPDRALTDVLQQDRERLRMLQQPGMLNDQLLQLYTEMEAEQRIPGGLGLELEEGETTTSSSSAEESINSRRQLRRRVAEFRQTMLYEENAPFPKPPNSSHSSSSS